MRGEREKLRDRVQSAEREKDRAAEMERLERDKTIEMEMIMEKAKLELEHEFKMKQLEMGRSSEREAVKEQMRKKQVRMARDR